MCGFSFTSLLSPFLGPSFPILSFSPPPIRGRGSRRPLGECCFQSGHVSSTLAQFAVRSVSWHGAVGSPLTIIDLAYSSASRVPLSLPVLAFVWKNCLKIYCGAESHLLQCPHHSVPPE